MGFLLVYLAYYQYDKTEKLLDNGIKTGARVIELITQSDSDGNTYKPVFEYTDRSGLKRQFTSSVSSNPPAFLVGDRVELVYNPLNYDDAKVISYWGLYRGTIILLAFAFPFLIIGLGYFLYRLSL